MFDFLRQPPKPLTVPFVPVTTGELVRCGDGCGAIVLRENAHEMNGVLLCEDCFVSNLLI